ncbi:hypothetical protein KA013_02100 [Patescibacteria group bacterium]|nr:hypothetical protein [Patescibacteria group bacterium]
MKLLPFLIVVFVLILTSTNVSNHDGAIAVVDEHMPVISETGLMIFCLMLSVVSYLIIQIKYKEMIRSRDSIRGGFRGFTMYTSYQIAQWSFGYGVFLALLGLMFYIPLGLLPISDYMPYILGLLYLIIYVIPLIKQYRVMQEIQARELAAKSEPDPVTEYIKKLMREKEALAAEKGTG